MTMNLKLQDINLYISESDVVRSVVDQRLHYLKSQEPRLRLVLPHGITAFVWLFMILVSCSMLGISVIRFSLNLIVISKVYSDFGLLLVCLLLIPVIVSCKKYIQAMKKHKNQLHSSKTEPISMTEIEQYFSDKKVDFVTKYQRYVDSVYQEIETVQKKQYPSSDKLDEVERLQGRIAQAVDRLEALKDNYFARLDNIESELKNRLIEHKVNQEVEMAVKSQFLIERLEDEVEAISYYLQAVDEIS